MAQEIEFKFLLKDDFPKLSDGSQIRQGYLNRDKERTVRVRLINKKALLTIKGLNIGGVAPEYEYPIPLEDAVFILDHLCERPLIEKTRYKIEHAGMIWEVDVFTGDNEGLTFAEIELENPDQLFEKPPWIGKDITGDPRYFNSNLSRHPYTSWDDV